MSIDSFDTNYSPNSLYRLFTLSTILLAPLIFLGILLVQFSPSSTTAVQAAGNIYYVTTDGSGNICSLASPCLLDTAMGLVVDNDEVRIAAGVYANSGSEEVIRVSHSITIHGGFNPSDLAADPEPSANPTILDAQGNGRVIYIDGYVNPAIIGFTIQNGNLVGFSNDNRLGAGIYNENGRPLIQDNIIDNNNAGDRHGGGIFDEGGATIINNTIKNNQAVAGGGIYINLTTAVSTTIKNNTIFDNIGSEQGGGIAVIKGQSTIENNTIYGNGDPNSTYTNDRYGAIFVQSEGDVNLYNNLIYNNSANFAGGVGVLGTLTLWNNTIVANTSTDNTSAGGLYIFFNTANVDLNNTILALNEGATNFSQLSLSTGASLTGTHNNISGTTNASTSLDNTLLGDPGFINPDTFVFGLITGSQNIDAAAPTTPPFITTDYEGQARPNGAGIDIGADEYYPSIPNLSLTPASRNVFVERGETVNFLHTLVNLGTINDVYTISCANPQTDWVVTCPAPNSISLAPGESADLTTQVIAPLVANAYDQGVTIITATSTVSPDLFVRVTAVSTIEPQPGIEFSPNYSQTATPGEVFTLTHFITNTGDSNDTYIVTLLTEENTASWGEVVPADGFSLEIPSGSTRAVQVRITVAPNAAAGIRNLVKIQATSSFTNVVSAIVTDTITARATAGTRYVSPTPGPDTPPEEENNCTQSATPCQSVEHAVGQASFGDAILIQAGTYEESTIALNDSLDISGGWTTDFATQRENTTTILDANGNSGGIFNIGSGSSIQPTISNLTLQNGSANSGGAVNIGSNAQPVLTNIRFINNTANSGGAIYADPNSVVEVIKGDFVGNDSTANDGGGAVYVENAAVSILQSTFLTNTSQNGNGGAIYHNLGFLEVKNSLFMSNTSGIHGGAIYIENDSINTEIDSNTIISNVAAVNGGAIYNDAGVVEIRNTNFDHNTATGGSGSAVYQLASSGSTSINYSNLWPNGPAEAINTTFGSNNLQTNPGYADSKLRLTTESPLLDKGDPTTRLVVDFEDDSRPADQGFDIGYDELAGCRAKRGDTTFGSIQEAIAYDESGTTLIQVAGVCRGVGTDIINGETLSQTVYLTKSMTIQGGWTSDFSDRTKQLTLVNPQGFGRAFYINGDIDVVIEGLRFDNGDATGLGGGISNADAGGSIYVANGTLTLNEMLFYTNTADIGAAVYFSNTTDSLISNSEFHINKATTAGGAIYAHSGDFIVQGGEFANNNAPNGGAIYNREAEITIENLFVGGFANPTHLHENTALDGGAIYNLNGLLDVDSARIYENSATTSGGALYNSGPITMVNTVIFSNTANLGAGIYHNLPSGDAFYYHTNFISNTATTSGGGFYNAGVSDPTIRSSIFEGNAAANPGAAIFAENAGADLDYNFYAYQTTADVSGDTKGANSITNSQGSGLVSQGIDPKLDDDGLAVDAGDPQSPIVTDYEGGLRPSSQAHDIGADEVENCLVQLNGVVYGSIQLALHDATEGDTLRVSGICSGVHDVDVSLIADAGSCGGTNFQATTHLTKSVTLQGGWKADFSEQVATAILDAEQLGRALYVGPNITVTIESMSLINGNVPTSVGAGLCVDAGSRVTVKQSQIYSNTAQTGSAVYGENNAVTINGNHIFSNTTTANGTIHFVTSSGTMSSTVENNYFYRNTAANGGAFYNASGEHKFWHNTVYDNFATNGAGVYIATGLPVIRSNVFLSNTASSGADGIHRVGGTPTLGYNNFYGQTTDNFGVTSSSGNIFADPEYTDPKQFDFTFPITSPIKDTADPAILTTVDIDNDIRPSHLGPDMGADEIGGCYARALSDPATIYGGVIYAYQAEPAGGIIQVSGICKGAKVNGLTTQHLYVDKEITIDGNWNFNNAGLGVIDAVGTGRAIYVGNSGDLTTNLLTVRNGDASNAGGGTTYGGNIYNEGFLTIKNESLIANGTAERGGGIYNDGTLSMTLSYVRNNEAELGGGIYNNDTAEIVNGSEISDNDATYGGGIYQGDNVIRVLKSQLFSNFAPEDGAAIYLNDSAVLEPYIANNFIYRNEARGNGAGIYNGNTEAFIYHNTIITNTGSGLYSAATGADNIQNNLIDDNSTVGLHTAGSNHIVDYNNVIDNGINYDGTFNTAGPNDISIKPSYVDFNNDNFRLTQDSPGIDLGTADIPSGVDEDYDGDLRPTNGGPDMGADEVSSCLIRVDDTIFGVVQLAIDHAKGKFQADPSVTPTLEVARGECRGVQEVNGTRQLGYISFNLNISGSLQQSNFAQPSPLDRENSNNGGRNSSLFAADGEGRVLYIENGATVRIAHLVLAEGNATQANDANNSNGGAIYNKGDLTVIGSEICESNATLGGGVWGESGSYIQASGTTIGSCSHAIFVGDQYDEVDNDFFGNNATQNGGGIYMEDGASVDLINSVLYSNDAENDGGGLYNESISGAIFINSFFSNNGANNEGGGIYNDGEIEIYHTNIGFNQSGDSGSAIYNTSSSILTLDSSLIRNNQSITQSGTAAVHSDGASMTNDYNLLYNNSPQDYLNITRGGNTIVNTDPRSFFSANDFSSLIEFGNTTTPYVIHSPLIDNANPALLSQSLTLKNGARYENGIDFDAFLNDRPDGTTAYPGIYNDIGANEYVKDTGCYIIGENQIQQVFPGDTATFEVLIQNIGNPVTTQENSNIKYGLYGYTDTITITLDTSGDNNDWATFEGGTTQAVELGWRDYTSRTLTVTVPENAASGLFDLNIVNCQSTAIPSRSFAAEHRVNVGQITDLSISPEYTATAKPGDVLTFTHTISNAGNEQDTFVIVGNVGSQAVTQADLVSIGGITVTGQATITLDPGEIITAELRVTILDTAAPTTVKPATPGLVGYPVDSEEEASRSVLNQITIEAVSGTRYLAPNGRDENNNCLDPTDPCATLSQGLGQAISGDEMLLAGGIYTGSMPATIDGNATDQVIYLNKQINLRGGFTPDDLYTTAEPVTNTTVINAQGVRRGIYIADGLDIEISGLNIQNGTAHNASNGINDLSRYGGGIYNNGSNLTITSTRISQNSAKYGGGIYQNGGDLTIASSILDNNNNLADPDSNGGQGGGIYVTGTDLWLENNTFVNNDTQIGTTRTPNPDNYGGALLSENGTLTLLNNIFSTNRAETGSSVYISGTTVSTADTNLYHNNQDNSGTTSNVTGETNVITNDPEFIDSNYRIQITSAAYNAGTETGLRFGAGTTDFEGEDRISQGTIDIGADEWFAKPDFTITPATASASVNAGELISYVHVLRNSGNGSDSYTISLDDVLMPNDQAAWETSVTPETVANLDPSEEISITLFITAGSPGYINQSTISVESGTGLVAEAVDTTSVTSVPGVEITANESGSADSGETITYTHTVTNTGNGPSTINIEAVNGTPSDWQLSVTPVELPFLGINESATITVTVTVPDNEPAGTEHAVTILATSGSATAAVLDTTTVTVRYDVSITDGTEQSAESGASVTYNHIVTNDSNVAEIFDLAVVGNPGGFNPVVNPNSVTLGIGESATVTVTVSVPAATPGGTVHEATVTATSQAAPAVQASAINTTTVLTQAGVEVTPLTADQTSVEPSTTVTYTYQVANSGNISETFLINVSNTNGTWLDESTPDELSLDIGETGTVIVTLTVPSDATPADVDTLTVTATGETETTATDSAQNTTRVRTIYGLEFAPNNSVTTTAGTEVIFTHTITNTGNNTDTYTINATSSNGWLITIPSPQEIAHNTAQQINITLTVPVTAGGLIDTMNVTATSVNSTTLSAAVTNVTDVALDSIAISVTLTPDNEATTISGDLVTYTHQVENTGFRTETFDLTADSSENWSVTLSQNDVTLVASASETIIVSVTIPITATDETVDTTTITATSQRLTSVSSQAVNTTTIDIASALGLELGPDPQIAGGNLGEVVTFTQQLTNTGILTDTYDITSASDWSAAANITSIELAPNESVTFTVQVTINAGASYGESERVVITATSRLKNTVYDTVANTVSAAQVGIDVSLTPDNVGSGRPNTQVVYTHTLTNTGATAEDFTIAVFTNDLDGWSAEASPTSVNLGAGISTTVIVTVNIPALPDPDELHVTTVRASIDRTGDGETATNSTSPIIEYSLELTPDNAQTAIPNQVVTYTHTLTNTGDLTDTVNLTADSSLGWSYSLSDNSLTLGINESAVVEVVVTVPNNATNAQVDTTTVTATSVAGGVEVTATNQTTVVVTYGVEIAPDNQGTAAPGTVVTYTHTVTNTSNVADTITLTSTSSLGWTIDLSQSSLMLGVNETADIIVSVNVPSSASDGQIDTATITATSTGDGSITDNATDQTTVAVTYGLEFGSSQSRTGAPGEAVTYTHRVTNTSNTTATISFSTLSSLGWGASVNPTAVTLGPNGTADIVTTQVIPSNAADAAQDTLSVIARLLANGTTRVVINTTTAEHPPENGPIYLPYITKGVIPVASNIDLVVTGLEIVPNNPTVGTAVTVRVTIENQGSEDVPFGNNFYVDFYDNQTPDTLLGGSLQWGVQGEDFTAGASVTFEGTYTFTGNGSRQLWAQVDTDNTVNEFPNEDNNIFGPLTVTVSGTRNADTPEVPLHYGPRPTPVPVNRP